jgi:hypothetical protein
LRISISTADPVRKPKIRLGIPKPSVRIDNRCGASKRAKDSPPPTVRRVRENPSPFTETHHEKSVDIIEFPNDLEKGGLKPHLLRDPRRIIGDNIDTFDGLPPLFSSSEKLLERGLIIGSTQIPMALVLGSNVVSTPNMKKG